MTRLSAFEAAVWPLVSISICAKVTFTDGDGGCGHVHLRAGEDRALVSLTPRFQIVEILENTSAFDVRVPTPGSDLVYGFLWRPGDARPIRLTKAANRDAHVYDARRVFVGDDPCVMYC